MGEKIIQLLAKKLEIHSNKAILKAEELKRLADLRASSTAFNLTGTCQAVVCLNLATNELNLPFNKENAIKFSGLRRKMYINAVETYKKLLGLQTSENLSAKDVAEQFECSKVGDLAQELLNRFKEVGKFNYPQIALATSAVFILCKKTKTKIDKRELVEYGRVSRVIFDQICSEMEKHSNFIKESTKLKKVSHASKSFLELVHEKINEVDASASAKQEHNIRVDDDDEEVDFNYEEWKKKILDED